MKRFETTKEYREEILKTLDNDKTAKVVLKAGEETGADEKTIVMTAIYACEPAMALMSEMTYYSLRNELK